MQVMMCNTSGCSRSKTYRHHRHCAVNSIGRGVGGAKRVDVVSVLSPVPGLKRTDSQAPITQSVEFEV